MTSKETMNVFYQNSVLFKRYIKTINHLFALLELTNDIIIIQIMKYRFIYGYSWNKIASTIGYSNADTPRMILTRFIKRYKQ